MSPQRVEEARTPREALTEITRILAELSIHTRRLAWCAIGPGAGLAEDALEATSRLCLELGDGLAAHMRTDDGGDVTTVARIRLFEGRIVYSASVVLDVARTRLAAVARILEAHQRATPDPDVANILAAAAVALLSEAAELAGLSREVHRLAGGGVVNAGKHDTLRA